jgi:hypothetical protein
MIINIKRGDKMSKAKEAYLEYEITNGLNPKIHNYVKELEEKVILDNTIITNLHEETVELKAALQLFCTRVEMGEVRSKKTYAQFKELLDKYL